jgi:hypothetical protein
MLFEIKFRPSRKRVLRQFKLAISRSSLGFGVYRAYNLPPTPDTAIIRRRLTGYSRYKRWWRFGLDILIEWGS